jgi:hypothetical protein
MAAGAAAPMLAQADPPLPGAVFTTDAPCTAVNLNIYAAKGDVYINGGPAHPGAAGLLPNTSYYVQVTDPSGAPTLGTSIGMANQRPAVTDSVGNFVSCYQLQAIVGNLGVAGYNDTPNPGGEYKVWVSTDSTFANSSTKTDNFKIRCTENCPPPTSTDGKITIRKFYDRNTDGVRQGDEPFLPDASLAPYGSTGWKVDIIDLPVQYTQAQYTGLDLTSYTTREYTPIQNNWYSTAPTPVQGFGNILNRSTVTLTTLVPEVTVDYGNVCTGAGGGFTLGFWSNKNGQALVGQNELAALRALNLANPAGTAFDPTTYAQLRTWLLNGNAVNMAYMLSVQLAAMKLNAITGRLTGGTASLVYAPGVITPIPHPSGFISIAELMDAANLSLGDISVTLAGVPQRVYQELVKNALDNANNNKTFVQYAPCLYTFAP